MMSDRIIYTPREEKKTKKPYKKIILLIGIIFALGFSAWGSIYVLRLPELQIKNVIISGLVSMEEESVKKEVYKNLSGSYFGFVPKRSYFAVNPSYLKQSIRDFFPRIEEISITKNLPDVIRLKVKERILWGIFCVVDSETQKKEAPARQCAYMDKTGFAYEGAPLFFGILIPKIKSSGAKLEIPGQILDPALMEELVFLAEETAKNTGVEVTEYELSPEIPAEIKVLTGEGFKIFFKRESDYKNSFQVLKTVMEEEIKDKRSELDYVDLRFGNKVFFKYRTAQLPH